MTPVAYRLGARHGGLAACLSASLSRPVPRLPARAGRRRRPRRPVRGADRADIFDQFGPPDVVASNPSGDTLRYTDDTQMMIGVAETLVEHGRIEPDALARAFAANYHPDRGYGQGARRIIETIQAGGDWRAVGRDGLPRRVARQRGRHAGRPGRAVLPRRPGPGLGAGPALGPADPPPPGRDRGGPGDGPRRRARREGRDDRPSGVPERPYWIARRRRRSAGRSKTAVAAAPWRLDRGPGAYAGGAPVRGDGDRRVRRLPDRLRARRRPGDRTRRRHGHPGRHDRGAVRSVRRAGRRCRRGWSRSSRTR